ncbi:response regulator [Roseibium sp.]|uniref:response regulator n=1 Tax=Roseibium sp. TaxID=1936156 RepID=UPI003A96BD20
MLSRKLKILHVEDDQDIVEITRLSLSLSGHIDIEQCSSPKEALEFANHNQVDALLLDVVLPDMGGEVLLQELRKLAKYAHTPAIFMTARAQENDRKALIKAGGIAVILKPFDPLTLSEQIMYALAPFEPMLVSTEVINHMHE